MAIHKRTLRAGLATLALAGAIAAAGPAHADIALESPARTAGDIGSSAGSLDPAVGSSAPADSGSGALMKILEPSGHGLSSVEDMLPAALRGPVAEAFARFLIGLTNGSSSPCTTNCSGGRLP
ncbi:hypothetical protein [Nocardia sp. NPDC057668]|uniref:hypothetical protein n=1 Tax=Nocardia sp. NPDC057668 TaxID=3346202 RepID=UPI00366CE743